MSEGTYRLVRGYFDTRPIGEIHLKGRDEPVAAWEALAAREQRTRLEIESARGLTPFVGRDDELRLLMNRWEHVLEGDGQVVTIVGEAGIGKSRLLQRFHEQIAGTPQTWIEAATAPLRLPFAALGFHDDSDSTY